jgi:hypothetical protein
LILCNTIKGNRKDKLKYQALTGLKKCITPEEEDGDGDEDEDPMENFMQALLCLIRFLLSD